MSMRTGEAASTDAMGTQLLDAVLFARRTVLPKRLGLPGPDADQLQMILSAAAAAPDHGMLTPWRFVRVPEAARVRLADAFEQALIERDDTATAEQRAQAREKAFRSPELMLAVVRLGPDHEEIPATERMVSAGCAIQNMLLMATMLGFGSALTSGKAMDAAGLRQLFGLSAQEQALCFLSIGTVLARKPGPARPAVCDYVSELKISS